jgi:hypothetical protein
MPEDRPMTLNSTPLFVAALLLCLAGCGKEDEDEGGDAGAGGSAASGGTPTGVDPRCCRFKADPTAAGEGELVDEARCTYALWTNATTDDPIPGDVDENPDASQRAPGGARTTHSIDFEGTGKPFYESAANYGYGACEG